MTVTDRKLIAEVARLSIETIQRISPPHRTPGLVALAASFKRIEDNPSWTAEQALQDHLNAMTVIAGNPTDLALLKSGSGTLFRNCEIMLNYLTKKEIASSSGT